MKGLLAIIIAVKNHITNTTKFLNKKNIFDHQIRWKYLKYKTKRFSVLFSIFEGKNVVYKIK